MSAHPSACLIESNDNDVAVPVQSGTRIGRLLERAVSQEVEIEVGKLERKEEERN